MRAKSIGNKFNNLQDILKRNVERLMYQKMN